VINCDDAPQSSVEAPCPVIFATEHTIHLAYYIQNTPEDWDGKTLRIMDEHTTD